MSSLDPVPPSGYPKIAVQMGLMPEVAIFRRFGFLNAQNILYMQAELVCLEERLRKLQVKDDNAPEPKSRYAKNWWMLSVSEDHGDDEQWKLVQEIREKLKEYNKALIQQKKIVASEPPSAQDLRYIQRYLESSEMDEFLTGKDADVWGSVDAPDDRAPDLLSLLPRHKEDFFSRWVMESAIEKLLELNQGRKPASAVPSTARRNNLVGFKDDTVLRWTFILASMLASALPILSIAILYCVKSLKVRLGLIAVFNLLLSFSLAAFTSAKRTDVFAVSAAFSAVQVVFVQVGTNDTEGVIV
ncbi:hypothetical protein GTA08_BOTSDO09333 [Neofusicoccum parvum]|nr:hypothetical protein GTA08_BOTSDO09333 [Neofusicoccum parvum]